MLNACALKRRSVWKSCPISLTRRRNASLEVISPLSFWKRLISLKATVPGLKCLDFFSDDFFDLDLVFPPFVDLDFCGLLVCAGVFPFFFAFSFLNTRPAIICLPRLFAA